ncbi:hypothetical protein [Limnochorda pilosa]|uniref:Uncharacterized protein n=1 Tax=Limnochorda pilosa TaxID=1555112 RepID=A0A0K2SHW6_LIMPI|nr:hypothetical protein [Limnochorda pilosa]BAS26444.1 hypothetical protein LIP_0587 [Limnochorda pilosa]
MTGALIGGPKERPRHDRSDCIQRLSQVDDEIRALQQRLNHLPRQSQEAREVEEELDRLIVEYLRLKEACGDQGAGR